MRARRVRMRTAQRPAFSSRGLFGLMPRRSMASKKPASSRLIVSIAEETCRSSHSMRWRIWSAVMMPSVPEHRPILADALQVVCHLLLDIELFLVHGIGAEREALLRHHRIEGSLGTELDYQVPSKLWFSLR